MRFRGTLEQYRYRTGSYASGTGDDFGVFMIPGPFNNTLKVLASSGDASLGVEWEHVSVSLPNRCPNWPEMCFIKELFWDDEEAVMQLHPAKSTYVNNHPYCLHLWRPTAQAIPLPPQEAV